MRRRISQALILVLLLSVVALPGQYARASTDIQISGPVVQGQWTYYSTPRFV